MSTAVLNFIRVGENGPAPAGTYVRVAEIWEWLRRSGYDEAAAQLSLADAAPPTETAYVAWQPTAGAGE